MVSRGWFQAQGEADPGGWPAFARSAAYSSRLARVAAASAAPSRNAPAPRGRRSTPRRGRSSGEQRGCASLAMIGATYGHLAADAERVELDLLDAYDATCGRGLAIGMNE